MTLSVTIIQLTGFLRLSEQDVSEHGLKTYRTGVSAVTDTGAHLLISGSVTSAVRCIQSEVLQSLKNFPITALMILSFTDHTLMQLLFHVNVAAQ